MEVINSVINYFKNISTEQILTMFIAIVIVILFCLLSSLIAYGIIKIFKNKWIPIMLLSVRMWENNIEEVY